MDRLLAAVANRPHRAILDCLLDCGEPLSPLELRTTLRIASKDRAHFGRQVAQLHDAGVLERPEEDEQRYVVSEREQVERFLQSAADLRAALDARRATRSQAAARARRKRTITRETRRVPPAENA